MLFCNFDEDFIVIVIVFVTCLKNVKIVIVVDKHLFLYKTILCTYSLYYDNIYCNVWILNKREKKNKPKKNKKHSNILLMINLDGQI